jgi:D-threo-aldose 1-dehydrogenase
MSVVGDYGRIVADRVRRSRIAPVAATGPAPAPASKPEAIDAAPASAPGVVAIRDFTPDGVRRSARESLERLGREQVEIMLLHDPDGVRGPALERAWEPIQELRESGAAGAIGISSNGSASLAAMLERLDADVVLLAGRYTLLDQSALDDLLPLAERRGVGVILGGIFNGGVLADPVSNDRFDYRPANAEQRRRAVRIAEIGARYGVPIAAAAIQFAAAHPVVSSVVVGVRSVAELGDDLAWARARIPPRFWAALTAEGLLRLDAPVPDGEHHLVDVAG